MAPVEVTGIEGLGQIQGQKIGPTDWIAVDQDLIDRYAEVSGDRQWIHTDPERAREESPFGRTIAHGDLTLSLIDGLRPQLVNVTGVQMAVNYGWNRVRFPAPVPSGSRIRASSTLTELQELDGGWFQIVNEFEVEVEGSAKPACVAESVGRLLAAG